jgi:hypothetical protein
MESKRLVFKFYKSYFEVAMELSDKDRLVFYDAIMKRQFYGIEPKLNGMVKFAYISQKHNIDKQVKGWEDFTKNKLTDNQTDYTPIIDPIIGCAIDPMIQLKDKEEEEEEEKEEIKYSVFSFEEFWNLYEKKVGKPNSKALFEKTTETERKLMKEYIPKYKIHKPDLQFRKDPERFLKYKVWEDEIPTVSKQPQQVRNTNTIVPTSAMERNLVMINGKWQYED